ncbi:MAG: hypothetical protein O3A20_01235 [Planctomycetota bacterium]|nr:hypothetical protein [Planctomycetota bacterium]
MNTPLLLTCGLLLGATTPAFSQSIVRSWDVAPVGAAFVGGVEYDCNGDVCWVVDSTNDLLSAYTGNGVLINSWTLFAPPGSSVSTATPVGVTWDQNTGMVWIGDEAEYCYEFDPVAGAPTGLSWTTVAAITDLSGLSIDPATGNIIVVNDSGMVVAVFTQAGAVVNAFSVSTSGTTDPDGIVYNHDTGHYFLGDDSQNAVYEVDGTGVLVNSWPLGGLNISPEGLGIDSVNGLLYIGDGFVTRKVYVVDGIVPAGGTCPGSTPVPTLAKTGACPGLVTLTGTNLTPNRQMALLHGPAGSFTKPSGTCAGIVLAIRPPTLAAMLPTNGSGVASISFNAPSAYCGRTVQGVDVATCTPTNALVL